MLNTVPPSTPVGSFVVWLVRSWQLLSVWWEQHKWKVNQDLFLCCWVTLTHSFVGGSLKASLCSNRAEEMNSSQLTQLEEDIQQQLLTTEERVRQEVSVTPTCSGGDAHRLNFQAPFVGWASYRCSFRDATGQNWVKVAPSARPSLLLQRYLCVCDAARRGRFTCLLTKSLCEVW